MNEKSQLLLPRDWEWDSLRSNAFEATNFQGVEVVGAPVGSPDFCRLFVKKTLEAMMKESSTLTQLHPQCATRLLKECVCAAPAFLAQVCHPHHTKEGLLDFDNEVFKLFIDLLGGVGGDELECCDLGLTRARIRSFLPSRFNGVGLRSWDRAWFSSVASCVALEDADMNLARGFLKESGAQAYEYALDALGGPSYLEHANYELMLVGEPNVLSEGEFYRNLYEDWPKLRLQHDFLEEVCQSN